MKKIIRRLTVFALCAILAAAMPLASAQELFTPEGVLLTVQIAVTLPNGTLSFLPVTPVTSTMGDTVYWVDESMLSDDEIALLATAQLQLTSETGELYAELPLSDVGFAGAIDERLDVVSDMIPGGSLTILPAESAAPMDGEEADAVLSQYGFETPAPVEPEQPEQPERYARSCEYWIGWAVAYYQWYSGRKYSEIFEVLSFAELEKMYYTLHEADVSKFAEIADARIREHFAETNLKRIRTAYGCSQAELAKKSGVGLRSIQLYEQRQKDINKASAESLYKISRVLGCAMEDLLER